jgi:hypothetical protein
MKIPTADKLIHQVFSINNSNDFEQTALDVFRFQYHYNPVYQQYCNLLRKTPDAVIDVNQLPYLPISLFKSHQITTTQFTAQLLFQSSGTSQQTASRHFVKDASLYVKSFQKGFETFYGDAKKYCILGLLPSYLERGQSSLVYMVDYLVKQSGHPQSGFYLYDHKKLAQTLEEMERQGQPTLLIGVTYALLDFAAHFTMPLKHTIIMETGGMKGRKKELVRADVHALLQQAFGIDTIHSEYGMTELLSQAYAKKDGIFFTPPWMKMLLRLEDDPLTTTDDVRTGGLNIIDLANVYSCSFIATEDVGQREANGGFSVLGRLDNAEVRGCSLLSL